jgi:hypothetical protein
MSFRSQNRTFILDFIQENEVLKTSNKFKGIKKNKKVILIRANKRDSRAKKVLLPL